jgi:signal transduction histidine kinase
VKGFRWKLLAALGIVVSAMTLVGITLAERHASANAQNDFQHEFQMALASLHHIQEMRYREIAGRCDALVRNPRIHAALEDDALDLLYLNARDQLHDLVYDQEEHPAAPGTPALRATFYRFLDLRGAIIPPTAVKNVGELTALEERQLTVSALPDKQQTGYLVRTVGAERGAINEVIIVPIVSSETGENISALMVGFEPVNLNTSHANTPIRSGIWLDGSLRLSAFEEAALTELNEQVSQVILNRDGPERSFTARIEGNPYLVFYKKLNPASIFPPAYEVCVCPLAESLAAQRRLRWQIGGIGALALLVGLLVSHHVSRRFSAPVERLASDSVENQIQRARAEMALETTTRELERAARFSADASHQLKTPVTVLRAGLEELLAQDGLSMEMRDEVSALVHQTYRLNGVIQDLLLLSRMDAGRLRLEIGVVDLIHQIEGWLDDLSVLPDPLNLRIETNLPTELCIAGEKCYTTLIVQNLLENARKYNRADGRINVAAREDGQGGALLLIGNSGPPIAPAQREHIFERFHRGSVGENVPGHGLGLNLARELARLHGGDLRLVRSEEDWTEFEVRFRLASCAQLAHEDEDPRP